MTFDDLLLYARCVTDNDPIADQRMAALVREVARMRLSSGAYVGWLPDVVSVNHPDCPSIHSNPPQ